jgi:hypothetical protein
MCIGSPMMISSSPPLCESPFMLISPRTDHFDDTTNGVPAPPSPQIPWAAIPDAEAGSDDAIAFTDCWSANIIDTNTVEGATPCQYTQANIGAWEGLPLERSGEHIPSTQSMQDWIGAWEAEPSHGMMHEHGQIGWEQRTATPARSERLFGPGYQQTSQALVDHRVCTPITEKTVYEINEFCALLEPTSAGWQLQDIFATPTPLQDQQAPTMAAQQSPSPPEPSSDVDDDRLFEITLKSNALRALREAQLCEQAPGNSELNSSAKNRSQLKGPALMEEVTSKVAEMHVDPKTGIINKLMGMLSPSLLGFPTNNTKKKKPDQKKAAQMLTSSRRSERPATKSSTQLTNRRAQASVCKQLGLIQHEEEFNDEILAQYLSLYQQPLSTPNIQGLASLAEISRQPGFTLQDKELAALLKETPYAS